MASWRQQALIAAPVAEVWDLLSDPGRFPDWNKETLEITGAPTKVEKGSSFDITGRGPLRIKSTTTFRVEQLDDLREIKLRCQTSGFYSHWLLTEAQGQTFTELELGVEPVPGLEGRVSGAMHTKGYLRRAAEESLDGLRGALESAIRPAGRQADRK